MMKIDTHLAKAREAEKNKQLGDSLFHYAEAIRLLDEKHGVKDPRERAKKISEEDKHEALDCWLSYLYCKIEMIRVDSESLLYDMGSEIGRQIREVEREIKTYRIGNKVYLWNTLQRAYAQWEDERRSQGKRSEADELHHHMLKAHMKRDFWRIFA